jgi:methyl-accepting chemotaxis protein
MFANFKIRTLLIWGFGIIVAMISIMAGITYQKTNSVGEDIATVTSVAYPKVKASSEIRLNVMRNWANTLLLLEITDASESKRIADAMAANSKHITEEFDYLNKAVTSETGKFDLDALKKTRVEYTEVRKQFLELIKTGNKIEADRVLIVTLQPKLEAYVSAAGKLIDYQSSLMDNISSETLSVTATLKLINIVLPLLVALVAIVIATVIVRVVIHSLGGEIYYANEVVHQIASGNLGVEIRTDGSDQTSLLASMKKMRDQLSNMVLNIQKSALHIKDASQQLTNTSQAVANSSGKQSESTSAVAAAIEEMTVSIGHIANNTHNAHQTAIHSAELSRKGNTIIHNAADEMNKIATSVETSSETISSLEHRSNEISAVANIIKEIAEQTNLLALNAAIEAARAGEQGRGFAVVADEVRKLAERTTQSTLEITSTIKQIQEDTKDAVQSMLKSVEQVKLGLTLTQQAGISIQEIEAEAKTVAEVVNEIANSIKEQTQASNNISHNIESISMMVDENNRSTSNTAESARRMERLAEELTNSIGTFKLT